MEDTLSDLANISTTLFAVTVMLSMGLSLNVRDMLRPLRNGRLVLGALLANFVIVPLAALLLAELLGLDEDIRIGLILISAAAGAALVPKLVQMADGHVPSAVGVVVLLVVATLIYMPVVLPIMLRDVDTNPLGIAIPLAVQLLLPLGIGFLVHEYYRDFAKGVQPKVALVSNISLAALLTFTFWVNIDDVIGLFGSRGITAVLLLIAIAFVSGYLLGEKEEQTRRVLAFGTAQRNLAAAFVVGAGSFSDRPDVLAMLATAGLVGMLTVIPLAPAIGKLRKGEAEQERAQASARRAMPPAPPVERRPERDRRRAELRRAWRRR